MIGRPMSGLKALDAGEMVAGPDSHTPTIPRGLILNIFASQANDSATVSHPAFRAGFSDLAPPDRSDDSFGGSGVLPKALPNRLLYV